MYMENYYRKAILSPSLDTAVVIHGLNPKAQLAFARVGDYSAPHPPSSWTALSSPNNNSSTPFCDIIFHQGRLLALDYRCALTTFDLHNPLAPPLFRSPAIPLMEYEDIDDDVDTYDAGVYLVGSPDGRDLFLVYRKMEDNPLNNDNWPMTTMTKIFKVFKLDYKKCDNSYKWEQVESVGDLAFFVGHNCSMSLSATDFPPGLLKPNSIYFTDIDTYRTRDTGVFHLEDGSFQFYQLNDGIHEFDVTRPVWLMPPDTCS